MKALSFFLVVGGVFLLLTQFLFPLLAVSSTTRPILTPLVLSSSADKSSFGKSGLEYFEFSELKNSLSSESEPSKIFYLTIPKLGIKRAEVAAESVKLSPDERLGHYAGTELPGEVGSTFIFGHSALPIFYNPKDYRTIFSTLDTLEKGDVVIVEYGEKYFRYLVERSAVLDPKDVRPLDDVSPRFLRKSYVTLMTCVPPGLDTKRLLVYASLAGETALGR